MFFFLSRWVCVPLGQGGEDVINQSTLLVGKIHSKLLILESSPALEETRGRALMAVRNLASHNAIAVIDSLLAQHPLPFDNAVVRIFFLFSNAHSKWGEIVYQGAFYFIFGIFHEILL
jgi:hypothetical protein